MPLAAAVQGAIRGWLTFRIDAILGRSIRLWHRAYAATFVAGGAVAATALVRSDRRGRL